MKYWLDEIATMRPGVTHRKVIVLDTIKNARRREPKDVSGIKNVDPPFHVRGPSDLLCNRIRMVRVTTCKELHLLHHGNLRSDRDEYVDIEVSLGRSQKVVDYVAAWRACARTSPRTPLTKGVISSDQALRGYKAAMDAALGRGSHALTDWIEGFR